MSHTILVTGAAGGQQGSTGRLVATRLLKQGLSVRAFVHKLDARCDELLKHGAEIVAVRPPPGIARIALAGISGAALRSASVSLLLLADRPPSESAVFARRSAAAEGRAPSPHPD
jgi:hypothetical protein